MKKKKTSYSLQATLVTHQCEVLLFINSLVIQENGEMLICTCEDVLNYLNAGGWKEGLRTKLPDIS